jgi:beta-mannosidase
MRHNWIALVACLPLGAAQTWNVQFEEPTGIYRRYDEVVSAPLAKFSGKTQGFRVVDPQGRELPWQASDGALLFPASVIPGDLPVYHVTCCEKTGEFSNQIVLRNVGMRRIELGNSRFRVLIDSGAGAIVEAYSMTAGPQRILNLVETTPDAPWKNIGWSSVPEPGGFTKVDLLETGPLRGRLRLSNDKFTWEFRWTAGSGALNWRVQQSGAAAPVGFQFASVSASPYLPFDRFVDGGEYEWPQGDEGGEPPHHEIGPRNWKKLPGGSAVYYQRVQDYGALGFVALDQDLDWKDIGTRHILVEKFGSASEIALTFPRWAGDNTVLEARRENRILRQPLLVRVSDPLESGVSIVRAAARKAECRVEAAAGSPAPFEADSISLDGDWELAHGEKGAGPQSDWVHVTVPGTVHTQILPPPKFYTHEADWISYQEWWYRKTFRVPASFEHRHVRLQFDATDYYADAYLNGTYLGRHEGYIDPYEYDVSKQLKAGDANVLTVRVWTPVSYYWRHRPYTVKGSYGAVDQKPDDITPLGITRPVRVLASAQSIIRDVAVNTRLAEPGAEVEVDLSADQPKETTEWELTLAPRNFQSSEGYRLRGKGAHFTFHLNHPQLWWTWDHGKPNLYTLDIRLMDARGRVIDGKSMAVGIREIEKIGWVFYLNHRRMFIRGTNYYYNLFLSEMDRAKYQRDLKLIMAMNVNMIRLHCHFPNPEFYDLADENGVLIWQDYLEAWYPHDIDFARRAAALYDPHIRYVRNHPSVAIWATSDEEDLQNYTEITKHLQPRLFLLDPQHRAVVRSTGRYGDGHIYHGWYEGSIWQYTKMSEPFVSELGATALPNYESLIKFLPNAWPIKDHEEEWVFHKLQIPEATHAWGDPTGKSLQEYIPITQNYVARLFQLSLERARRLKYETGGILHFHAIDIWPSVTMAAIDFYRVPTKVFYTVQRSFAPVAANFEYDRDQWRSGEEFRCGLWVINDEWREIPGAEVRWRVVDSAGRTALEGTFPGAMAADSARKLGDVTGRLSRAGDYKLIASVQDAQGKPISENIFEFLVM